MADQHGVDIRHVEPDAAHRTQQLAHANPAIDQQDRSPGSEQERVSRAAAAETRNFQHPVLSEPVPRRQASALLVQGTLTAARQ
jgi:hypothetical protein